MQYSTLSCFSLHFTFERGLVVQCFIVHYYYDSCKRNASYEYISQKQNLKENVLASFFTFLYLLLKQFLV